MEENITVYTSATVSREAYENILQQLDAQFKVMPVYDALISRDNRHARFVRHTKEDGDPYGLLDEEDESVKIAAHILGEQPQTRIEISTSKQVGSINILVDFVLLFASLYPCVVIDAFLERYTPEEFAQRAEAGYDGYRWDATHTMVVKGSPETPEEKSQRLRRERKEKVLKPTQATVTMFRVYTTYKIHHEDFERFLLEVGAELTPQQIYDARFARGGRMVRFTYVGEQDCQVQWDKIPEDLKTPLERALGGKAQTIVSVEVHQPLASVNIALDFMLVFDKHYPCVVLDEAGEISKPQDLLEFAQPGYDGYHWNAEHTRIVKNSPSGEWDKEQNRDD